MGFQGQVVRIPFSASALGAYRSFEAMSQLRSQIGFANNSYELVPSVGDWVASQNPPARGEELSKVMDPHQPYRGWKHRAGPAPMGPVVEFSKNASGAWEQMSLVAAPPDPDTNTGKLELFKVPGVHDVTVTQQWAIMGQNVRLACNEMSLYGLRAIPKLRVVTYGPEVDTPNFVNLLFQQLPLAQWTGEGLNPSSWNGQLMPVFEGQLADPANTTGDPVLVNAVEYLRWVKSVGALQGTGGGAKTPLYDNTTLGLLVEAQVAAGTKGAQLGAMVRAWADATA